MRKLLKKITFLGIIVIIALANYSCNTPPRNVASDNLVSSVWIPTEVKMERINDNVILSSSDSEWEYVGFDKAGKLISTNAITVTCKCSAGSGCDPVKIGDLQGCKGAGCNNCSGTITATDPTTPNRSVEIEEGGFVRKSSAANVSFVNRNTLRSGKMILASPSMLNLSRIKSSLQAFRTRFQSQPNDEIVEVLVNIAGRIGIVEVPRRIAILNRAQVVLKSSCACDAAGGSCPKISEGGVTRCDNGCVHACTLNALVARASDDLENARGNTFKIRGSQF